MKQRPIIFSAPMVPPILAGKKTQTRRVVKRLEADEVVVNIEAEGFFKGVDLDHGVLPRVRHLLFPQPIKCPYGVIGDQLWVREGFRQELNLGYDKDGNWPDAKGMFSYFYKADCSNPEGWGASVWKSPLFMPRAASRILLEITNIRVERVQDISEQDAIAEGSYIGRCPCQEMQAKPKTPIEATFNQTWCHIHGDEYSHLFKNINGESAWESNPWVWVIEFKRVEDTNHAN